MKKKIKLISTFASLGLALALMVFGVYAATAVQFKVTTNVSFTADTEVQATITAAHTAALAKAPEAKDYVEVEGAGGTAGYTGNNWADAIADIAFEEVALSSSANVYSYKITIKNDDDERKLRVTATLGAEVDEKNQYTIEFNKTSGTAFDIDESGSADLIVTVTITDLAGNAVPVAAINTAMGLTVDLAVVA